jgi:NAD/NADP transhydrogenase beta subunit
MIQRIQTVYLAISMILLSIVAAGSEVFRFAGETVYFKFNSFGIQQFSMANKKSEVIQSYPLYLSLIVLVMYLFVALMAYKNLKRQLKLVRIAFYIYLLFVVGLLIFSSIGSADLSVEPLKRELGLGFFLFIAGLPFVFLANLSIKRDKKLIDSLNRLR